MKEIVIVLGAGASFPFGAPLMKDFYNVAASLYVERGAGDLLKRQFGIVFEFIDRLQKAQAKANIDLHNIESVYTALEMAQLLGLENLQDSQSETWDEMDRAMKYFLSKAIESRCQLLRNDKLPSHQRRPRTGAVIGYSDREMEEQTPLIKVIEHCIKLEEAGWSVSFITFNYDLVLESILGSQRVCSDYCLPHDSSPSEPRGHKSMKVLKLHGSINWELKDLHYEQFAITAHPIYPDEGSLGMNNPYFLVSESNKLTTQFSDKLRDPFLVPPVWNKSNYHRPINTIWREAARSLSKASHIYCLGYSLPQTDGFFRQLFALGTVGDKPLQQFQVFDIERADIAGGVHSRYRSMLGRGSENVFQYSDQGASGLQYTLGKLR